MRIVFSPADFVGQGVLIHGKAVDQDGKAWLAGAGWQIEIMRGAAWPEALRGARVAVTGVIRNGQSGQLQIVPRRVGRDNFAGQLNQRVEVRGILRECNDGWYLSHSGGPLLVENLHVQALQDANNIGAAVEVRGILRKERLRDMLMDDEDAEPKDRYILRDAQCSAVGDLLPIERVKEPCPWSIGER